MSTLSPLMRQYAEIKQKYSDMLLLFQVGDFYELFFDDAVRASSFLGIALTKRGVTRDNQPIPLCGVPVHTLDHYILKLVRGGFRVAICDQLTVATPGKVVERGVTRVLTPGTLIDSNLLHEKSASYLAAFERVGSMTGMLFVELLTGQIFITVLDHTHDKLFESELARFTPDEIVLSLSYKDSSWENYLKKLGYNISYEEPVSTHHEAYHEWYRSLTTQARDFINTSVPAQTVLRLLYAYLHKNQPHVITALLNVSCYFPDDFLIFDAATQRNLELVQNIHDGSTEHTLYKILDHAATAMGSRMIKKWLLRPLVNRELLQLRLDAVEYLVHNYSLRTQLLELFLLLGDFERVIGRFSLGKPVRNDFFNLIRALRAIHEISQELAQHTDMPEFISSLAQKIVSHNDLIKYLERALSDDTSQEFCIKAGFHHEFDRLQTLLVHGASLITQIEQEEQQATGISSLKIRYNAHGYGIEITKTHSDKVPDHYMRLQTLVNRERYTIQKLKDIEYDLIHARTSLEALEKEIIHSITGIVVASIIPLKKCASACAMLDALCGFAQAAFVHKYVRPQFHENRDIIITQGRHPMVAAQLQHEFIPNDTRLIDEQSLLIITGPNMGGKSTYLRQVALICIMAQAGSSVPAQSAYLPLLDKIFTRIGASDNVAQGKSTFLVEMEETALICRQATSKSLVILDEVGRGTSTYDGLAIAQAVIEYIYDHIKARCLFATHYHELTELKKHAGIVPFYAASSVTENGILLLHTIIPGIAQGSFGIDVARSAHVPQEIVSRAREIMREITHASKFHEFKPTYAAHDQEKLYNLERELAQIYTILDSLKKLDFDSLSPRNAYDILWNLRENMSLRNNNGL